MAATSEIRGSVWHRWDPHIHAPGTVLNDQYKGSDPWGDFLLGIAKQDQPIRALGITDYFLIDTYEKALAQKAAGKLESVDLIFPNVEIRLSIETSSSSAINAHLLFSPASPDHRERIRRLLSGFTFRYLKDEFRCERSELIRLGKAHEPTVPDEKAALEVGANQFKISFEALQKTWDTNDWLRNNCLVAVAGGQRDGTSGLRDETSSFAALRKSIEAFAHIIFSGNPQQVAFYQGKGAASVEDLNAKWGGRKPCLHGSDAHAPGAVGKPSQDRFCWIKGDLTFESLHQVCMEPEDRVFIGKEPPRGALAGNTIKSIRVTNAPWMAPSTFDLNPGLIAIIGARGSGKTALADLIAMGGCAVSNHLSDKSFLKRAKDHLGQSKAELVWESGDTTGNTFSWIDAEELVDAPHVQYLSQQFVDQLCSSEGLEGSLVREIQRVVFDAHPKGDRMGATTFQELLSVHLEGAKTSRARHAEAIVRASASMAKERARKDALPALTKDRDEKKKALAKDEADRKALVPRGNEARAKRHEEVSDAVDAKRTQVGEAKLRLQALQHLVGDVADHRDRVFPELLDGLQQERADAKLQAVDWKLFQVQFSGDVDALLGQRIRETKQAIARLEGPVAQGAEPEEPEPTAALIPEGTDLSTVSLRVLEREVARLRKLVGVDAQNARRLTLLSDKIAKAKTALAKVEAEIINAQGAEKRTETARVQRQNSYVGVFQAILDEEEALAALYKPLKERISAIAGSLAKLSFSVRRTVDIDKWASTGESLLDLRTGSTFRGKGAIREVASIGLVEPWESGNAEEAGTALQSFVLAHSEGLRKQRPLEMESKDWARDMSAWLFNTDHISVNYGLEYDGQDIEQLSPGTRGIVLLLLYLTLDAQDDRPLIIDQPEENLDPQSIYDELVVEFRQAKKRRQVIIVTHNANLVVNTDADQVIVAHCGGHRPGHLPTMSYESGGLENPSIREAVCAILEGGEHAFKERAKRLRVGI